MTKINPESRYFVVLDTADNCIAKHDTNSRVKVPVDDFDVIELDNQSDLDNYDYDDEHGYQT